MKQYLFVYGTLIPELAPFEIAETVKQLKFIGGGFVYGLLYDLGEYPAIILQGTHKVFGKVFELPNDEHILEKIDEYEGFKANNELESLYLRKQTTVYFNDKKLKSWVYEYNQNLSHFPIIESGNYLENLQLV
jgi:gamma-glutamylcyclotransferase (GGCT)/AIG2-like uncharacterized protein YtfP